MRLLIKSILIIGIFTGIVSCASIPASTATLSQQVIEEADAMHKLNLALIQQLFDERKNKVDDFINNQYIPAFTKNFQAKIPPGVDISTELPNILKSVMPVISRKRDSLHNLLDTQRTQMIASLNTSYTSYQQASSTLQNLISSAVKLKASESTALAQAQSLANTNIDVNKIQHHLDSLLIKTGNGFDKLLNIKSAINGN
jgi:vacuolar-type H+-ATPase subunit D/Vma8